MQYEIGYKIYRTQLMKIICVPASSFQIAESSVYSPVAYISGERSVQSTQNHLHISKADIGRK